jgi:hypothetical protein
MLQPDGQQPDGQRRKGMLLENKNAAIYGSVGIGGGEDG